MESGETEAAAPTTATCYLDKVHIAKLGIWGHDYRVGSYGIEVCQPLPFDRISIVERRHIYARHRSQSFEQFVFFVCNTLGQSIDHGAG